MQINDKGLVVDLGGNFRNVYYATYITYKLQAYFYVYKNCFFKNN